jgi:hypothetical protein
MEIRKWFLLVLAVAMILMFCGCGGGASSAGNSVPPGSSPAISIVFQPAPVKSVFINATATLTAVVSNDSSNAGVDWALLCPANSNCGSLSPLHTASGKASTYTPPTTIQGNTQTFTIEAFATADHSKNLVTPITATGFAGLLKGTYVFQTTGINTNTFVPYQLEGVIKADGNGNITAVEQTYSDANMSMTDTVVSTSSVSAGIYYIGPDERGTLTINTGDTKIGQVSPQTNLPTGIENFSLVMLSSSQALMAVFDNLPSDGSLGASGNSSHGTLDLQTSTAAPIKGYAFSVGGAFSSSNTTYAFYPFGMGGVLNIDSAKTISGNGSVADEDVPISGSLPIESSSVSGTVSDPDSFGKITFKLAAQFPGLPSGPLTFTGYIVDATHIKLIESDNTVGQGFGSTAGVAIAQGSATGSFIANCPDSTANCYLSGTYVYGLLGQDSPTPSSFSSAGIFTADGKGKLTNGYTNQFSVSLGTQYNNHFKGTYAVDPTGTGRVVATIPGNATHPAAQFNFYLTGNDTPPLMLDAVGDANLGAFAVATGVAYPQASGSLSLSGKYGLAVTYTLGGEGDGTGPFTVDPAAKPQLSGFLDFNNNANADQPQTGNIKPCTVNGYLMGHLISTNGIPFPTKPGIAVGYFLIDPGHGFLIETDGTQAQTLTLGYFAQRTPLCPTCP